jgi:hypothetical protein
VNPRIDHLVIGWIFDGQPAIVPPRVDDLGHTRQPFTATIEVLHPAIQRSLDAVYNLRHPFPLLTRHFHHLLWIWIALKTIFPLALLAQIGRARWKRIVSRVARTNERGGDLQGVTALLSLARLGRRRKMEHHCDSGLRVKDATWLI